MMEHAPYIFFIVGSACFIIGSIIAGWFLP